MDGYMIEWEAIHDLLTVRTKNGSYYWSDDFKYVELIYRAHIG